MSKSCSTCKTPYSTNLPICSVCGSGRTENENIQTNPRFLKSELFKRVKVFVFACAFTLSGLYISLVLSAASLSSGELEKVKDSIQILKAAGFDREVFYLEHLTVYRGTDNWLNASVDKDVAYAATNFPFEIMTLYPEFFLYPRDDVERAAVLLHEARHLLGGDESEAYSFVWQNRERFGWTKEKYRDSTVFANVRKQTIENAPQLFICVSRPDGDCTE